MIPIALAAVLAAAPLPPPGAALPPARVQRVLDQAAAELQRLLCYDRGMTALEAAERAVAESEPGPRRRAASLQLVHARIRLEACRRWR